MTIKRICQTLLLSTCLLNGVNAVAQDSPFGQTFQINTRLNYFVGKPSWLLILRDVDTGQVLPFLYDFNTTDNFWLGFTYAHAYQVTVSDLEFGPPNAVIHNFCHLQDGILDHESFTVNLTGNLTPNRHTSSCHVFKYKEFAFPIAESNTTTTSESVYTPTTTTPETMPGAVTAAPATPAGGITNAINNAVKGGVASGLGNIVSNALTGNLVK